MAGSVNKVIIVGNLGRDPEVRTFQNGGKVCNLRVATSETWKDRNTGERRETHGMAFRRDLFRRVGTRLRAIPAQRFQGLYRGQVANPQMAGPVRPGPLFDRDLPCRALTARWSCLTGRGEGGGGGGSYGGGGYGGGQGDYDSGPAQGEPMGNAPSRDIDDEIPF